MDDLLKQIQKFLYFINNENYINLISIFVVALTTYHVTKYTVLKPNRLAIKQSQLEYVYLPLHLVLRNLPQHISRSNALTYSKKIANILDRHYVFAFPQLHKLNRTLKSDIINDFNYDKTLRIMKHQIDIDYELLKKALGYPSENFHKIFVRMTIKQKAEFIVSWLNVLWIFVPVLFCLIFLPYFNGGLTFLLVIILLTFVLSLIMLKVNQSVRKMKD